MKKNKLLMPIAAITSLSAIAPTIALSSCGPSATSHIIEPTTEEKQQKPTAGTYYATYKIKLTEDCKKADLSVQIINQQTTNTAFEMSNYDVVNQYLVMDIGFASEPANTTSVNFDVEITNTKNSWTQTVTGFKLTYTNPDDIQIVVTTDATGLWYTGDKIQFNAKVKGETISNVAWNATPTDVATVDNQGWVTILKPGKFKVSASHATYIEGISEENTALSVLNIDSTDSSNIKLKGFVDSFNKSESTWVNRCNAEFGDNKLVIPTNINSISDEAFGSAVGTKLPTSITSVDLTLATGLTTIGKYAFASSGFTGALTIPDTVTSLGTYAFYNSTLTGITLPQNETIKSIPNDFCAYCSSLQTITIPEGYTEIGVSAFDSSALTTVSFPSTLTTIKDHAFQQTKLTKITLPSSVNSIETYAFGNIDKIEEVDLSAFNAAQINALTLGTTVFSEHSTSQSAKFIVKDDSVHEAWQTKLNTAAGVTWGPNNWNIKICAYSLFKIISGGSVDGFTSGISESAILEKTGDTLVIPNTSEQVASNAFNKNASKTMPSAITKLRFQEAGTATGTTFLGKDSFANSGITDVVIPKTLTYHWPESFRNTNITKISVNSASTTYTSQNASSDEINGLLSKDGATLHYGTTSTDLTSFTSLTKFDNYCYSGRTSLTTVKIPSTVTTIGNYMFENCTSLSTIDLSGFTTVPSWTNTNAFLNINSTASSKTIKVASGTTSAWQTLFSTIWPAYSTDGWTISEA